MVDRYQVEFNKVYFERDVPFEERWLDTVIDRKLRLRNLIDLGDPFLNTRLGVDMDDILGDDEEEEEDGDGAEEGGGGLDIDIEEEEEEGEGKS
mmetsp:Transcript_53176/g.147468  ORF Transcript_53176/g.147468 Transcript_53176/m.147468 type:complete len:94 (+) Transcript_53176:649-930(+)